VYQMSWRATSKAGLDIAKSLSVYPVSVFGVVGETK